MTSKISMRKILKTEIKQSFWMFALSALGHFIAGPVLFLLSISSHTDTLRTVSRQVSFLESDFFLSELVMIFLSICLAIFNYRYLFSKRMVDLYHSVPITRTRLFWVKYIHGFLVWFLPFAVCSLSVLLLSFVRLNIHLTWQYVQMITHAFFQSLSLLLLCFLILYHLVLTAVYLSGNVLSLFTNTVIMGVSVVSIYAICLCCAEQCLDTFCTSPSGSLLDLLFTLSPLTAPFAIFGYYQNNSWHTNVVTGHPLLIIGSALVSLGLLLLSLRLCLKRPSELAERGTIHKYYVPVARIATAFLSSASLALFFGEMVSYSFQPIWGIFGALLGGILGFGAINSIYHATIKAFFKNKVQMALVTLSGIFLILAFQLDLFGYDNYLPEKEQIAGIAVYNYSLSDNSSSILPDETLGFVYDQRKERVYQEQLLTDREICYHFLSLAVQSEKGMDIPSDGYRSIFSVYAKIQLENGHTYYRRYMLSDADYQVLAPFIETPEYKNTNYKASSGLLGNPSTVEIYLCNAQTVYELAQDNIPGLMRAYKADFEEHYNLEELSCYMSNISLELYFTNADDASHYIHLNVPENYSRTQEYLQNLYPESIPYITSPDQILSLTSSISQITLERYGGFYGYFGITDYGQSDTDASPADEESCYTVTTFEIRDPQLIIQFYPYLYFGEYTDLFGKRDYVYFADAQTSRNNYISCYFTPGTLSEELIEIIKEMSKEQPEY